MAGKKSNKTNNIIASFVWLQRNMKLNVRSKIRHASLALSTTPIYISFRSFRACTHNDHLCDVDIIVVVVVVVSLLLLAVFLFGRFVSSLNNLCRVAKNPSKRNKSEEATHTQCFILRERVRESKSKRNTNKNSIFAYRYLSAFMTRHGLAISVPF